MLLDVLRTLILGIVEGITEWLPISSTGHMILVEQFIGIVINDDFQEMFNVVIQLGAIMAVVVLYFKKLNPFAVKKTTVDGKTTAKIVLEKKTMQLWYKVVVACIPAGVVGLLLDDWIDEHFYNAFVVALTLIIYGVWFLLIETGVWGKMMSAIKGENPKKDTSVPKTENLEDLTYKTAFTIGMFQVLSLIPGTSRSGSTIIGGMLANCSRFVATEFTFFLAIPVMFGASLLKIVKFFVKGGGFSAAQFGVLGFGMIVSFVVSILAIRFLIGYIKKNDFKAFGVYRIILGIVVLAYFGLVH